MNEYLPWIATLIAVLLVLQYAFKALSVGDATAQVFRYASRQHLYTEAEMQFLEHLRTVVPNTHIVMGKVRLADLVEPSTSHKGKNYIRAFNRISSKHVDFVICDRVNYKIVAVIELDDSSHRKPSRSKRDLLVDKILDDSHIPIKHVKQARHYDVADIQDFLLPLVTPPLVVEESIPA